MSSGALLHSAIWSRMKICRRKVSSVVWLWAIRSGSVLMVAPCGGGNESSEHAPMGEFARRKAVDGRSRAGLPGVGGGEHLIIAHQVESARGLLGVESVLLADPQLALRFYDPTGQ